MAGSMTNSTCFFGGQPVTIQNATSWRAIGCPKGFYCPHNNATFLPQHAYQPWEPMSLRFVRLETTVLLGKREQRKCPKGFYCPEGSYEATKCAIASGCGEGSVRDMNVGPLVVLTIVDVALVLAVIGVRLKQKFSNRVRKEKRTNQATFKKPGIFRGRGFAKLDDERSQVGRKQSDIDMEERIMSLQRRPTGFEELGDMDDAFGCDGHNEGEEQVMNKDLQSFVESLSSCFGGTKFGLSFEFEDLKFQPPQAKKPILSQVSGLIDAGSLWGPTFVNVLMGKTRNTGGVTKVNGVAGDISKYKKVIGYVPQDDIVLPELTVRENILHSARIRLPCTWEEGEIQHHVDVLLACLQLSHVKDSLVGSTAAPVISGGQRKRVSIGIELAAAPMALFLDEPTSGLDATAANSIMKTLKALSRLGMTIVTIIHQPRQEIFESLDSLVLLGAGRMIYLGPQVGIKPHFEGLGFEFPEHGNPSDVMGDIIAAFFFELGVGALSGLLIGMSGVNKKGENFRGMFIEPYEVLSSSIDYSSIPQMALLVGLAIGLTASAPGVKVFGEENPIYDPPHGSGQLPFHGVVRFVGHPRISWVDIFAANLLYFWCVYGLASCVSMVTRREDGPLIAVMSSLIVGVLNGMSPNLESVKKWHMIWLWRANPGTWLAEGYFTQNITPMDHLYNIESAKEVMGYRFGHFTEDMVMLFALGAAYRVVAFLGLRFMYGHKQR
ncbi:hypothetical protein EYC84_009415 [Monilinia fructicola]|uniref:ABC transporter domain-containing protein n=1 Tax=Monilinia fructicola TaxID=38448 RepID=A0A5M9J8N9_MONFR|nr:hypothetical protein EYC84_009415 [Monilinia fructicola]